MINFLKRNNVNYVIDGGLLLGAARDRHEILWDDDYDIYMPGNGIRFETTLHATITNTTSVTIGYTG